ncbi:MAG TPA: indole-3-glycerol phosphate synthase TrpC [Actinomycetota bacterium]|nr:indole-3-glycerol phosphate synthase TrpC [Actinomycetota bacterium]
MGFLTRLVDDLRHSLAERPMPEGLLMARARAMPPPRPFAAALSTPGLAVIAEVKRASPSAGAIAEVDAGAQAERYGRAGAAAVSVLTEPRHFDGSLADLRLARRRTSLPLLRKDFLVHPAQVAESRVEGADAILLIAAALPGSELADMLEAAEDTEVEALVEVHDEDEVARAIEAGARVIGVNARDLETLRVDAERALDVARAVPPDRTVVLESAIATGEQARRAEEAGADAILVGEALMRAADPAALLAELVGRPVRAAAR